MADSFKMSVLWNQEDQEGQEGMGEYVVLQVAEEQGSLGSLDVVQAISTSEMSPKRSCLGKEETLEWIAPVSIRNETILPSILNYPQSLVVVMVQGVTENFRVCQSSEIQPIRSERTRLFCGAYWGGNPCNNPD